MFNEEAIRGHHYGQEKQDPLGADRNHENPARSCFKLQFVIQFAQRLPFLKVKK